MNDDNEQQPTRQPLEHDSRWQTFLRQATAIIAAEKGLTPNCRAKLKALADQIKLPDELFQQALDTLQTQRPQVENLTRYEAAFAKSLAVELNQLTDNLLSPARERRALDIASQKYQLNPARAEQILEQECEAVGVTRIAPDDACRYAEQLIAQQVGTQPFVADELRQKLKQLGNDWGLDPLQVDQLILVQVNQNRRQQLKSQSSRIWPLVTLLALLISIGFIVWLGWGSGFTDRNLSESITNPPISEPEAVSPLSAYPTATTQQLQAMIDRFKLESGTPDRAPPVEYRTQLLVELADTLVRQPVISNTDLATIASVYWHEPEQELATKLWNSIVDATESKHGPTVAQWKTAYRAAQLLQAIITGNPAPGSNRLPERTLGRTPSWLTQLDSFNRADWQSNLANRQWNDLIGASLNQPALAASLLEPLTELTEPWLVDDQLQVFRNEVLFNVCAQQPALVNRLRGICQANLERVSQPTLMRWIELALRRQSDLAFTSLAKLLAEHISSNQFDSDDEFQTLRQYVRQQRYQQFEPLMKRLELLDKQHQALRPSSLPTLNESQVAELIGQSAQIINLELFLIQQLNSDFQDDERLAEFDQLQRRSQLALRDSTPLPIDPVRREVESPSVVATASDKRRKDGALASIRNAELPEQRKLMAINQLHRVAMRFEDIEYTEATLLAQFLVSDPSIEAQLEIQKLVGGLSHWPTLKLAIADQLVQQKVSRDWAMTLVRLLAHREVVIPESTPTWYVELNHWLLRSIDAELADKIARRPESESSRWIRAMIALEQSCTWRVHLLTGQAINDSFPEGNPGQVLARNHQANQALLQHFAVDSAAALAQPEGFEQAAVNHLDQLTLMNLWALEQLPPVAPNQTNEWPSLKECRSVGQRLLVSHFKWIERLKQQRDLRTEQLLEPF